MTLTLELPESLTQELRERQVPEKEMQAIAVAALEAWLAERYPEAGGRFAESAVPFARRLIAQNRELFETLALA